MREETRRRCKDGARLKLRHESERADKRTSARVARISERRCACRPPAPQATCRAATTVLVVVTLVAIAKSGVSTTTTRRRRRRKNSIFRSNCAKDAQERANLQNLLVVAVVAAPAAGCRLSSPRCRRRRRASKRPSDGPSRRVAPHDNPHQLAAFFGDCPHARLSPSPRRRRRRVDDF